MSEKPTKERIFDAAEELMLGKSFHSVGLNEILAAVKVPKGSFYHHFESKEQFGVEMLRHYVNRATAYKSSLLLPTEQEPDALRRLLSYFEASIACSMANGGRCPCLVAKLAAEVTDFSEPMRAALEEGTRQWIGLYTEVIRKGAKAGQLTSPLPAAAMGSLIHDLWTGALQRAATTRTVAPLREAVSFLRKSLQPA